MKLVIFVAVAICILATFDNQVKASDEPSCPCPRIFSPVCSSEGRTYSNECIFQCHQKNINPSARIVRNGACEDAVQDGVYV